MSDRFLEEAQRIINSAYEKQIRVLVWGPGISDKRGYSKRKKIKAEIEKRFPRSIVYFSEDKKLRSVTAFLKEPLVEEIVHAQAAHLIIVLDTSRGADIEIDFFSQYDIIVRKLWVLIEDRFSPLSGLAAQILRGIDVEFYSGDEFTTCTLASDKCIRKVLACAIRQFRDS